MIFRNVKDVSLPKSILLKYISKELKEEIFSQLGNKFLLMER